MEEEKNRPLSEDEIDETVFVPGDKPKRSRTAKIIGIIAFVISNAVVLFFTARADFSKKPVEQGSLAGGSVFYLLGALLCLAVCLAAETFKYLLMMKKLGEKVSVRDAFETAALGKYYDLITPSGSGGQPFQIWHFRKKNYSTGASSAMPLGSFVLTQYAFVIIGIVVFALNWNVVSSVGLKIAAVAGLFTYSIVPTMILISALSPSLSTRIIVFFVHLGAKIRLIKREEKWTSAAESGLRQYSESLKIIIRKKALLFELFLLSVVFHLAIFSMPYFVIHVFGGTLQYLTSVCICVFVYASVTLIPTPGNAGAAEGSFYLLFSELGTADLFWSMLIWRFFCYYSFIIIGLLIYLFGAGEKLLIWKKGRKLLRKGEEDGETDTEQTGNEPENPDRE